MNGAGLPGMPIVNSILPAVVQRRTRVVAVVGAVEDVVLVDIQAVRALEHAFAPGAQEIAVPVEHHASGARRD